MPTAMELVHAADSIMVSDATLMGPLNWEAKREKIASLYLNHSVKQIKELMEGDGFFASEKQFKKKLGIWIKKGLVPRKNANGGHLERMIRIRGIRAKIGKNTGFTLNNQPYTDGKLNRYIAYSKRNETEIIALGHCSGDTPGEIKYFTPQGTNPNITPNSDDKSLHSENDWTHPCSSDFVLERVNAESPRIIGSILPDRLPQSEFPPFVNKHDDLHGAVRPEVKEIKSERNFAASKQKRVVEAMTPESVWELVPSLAITASPEELPVEADLRQRAMKVYEKHYGRSIYDPGGMKFKADDLWKRGRYGDAEELDRLTIEVAHLKLGPEHVYTLKLKGDLAASIFGQGRLEEAEKLESEVVQMMREKLGEYDKETLQFMGNLSCTYRSRGKWKLATELGKEVVWSAGHVLGWDHPDTLTHMLNLAKTYALQHQWAATRVLLAHVSDMRTKLFGRRDKQTLRALAVQARTLQEQGDWEEAEELASQISHTRQNKYNHLPLENLDSIEIHAYYLSHLGQVREAEGIIRGLVQTRTNLLSARHPETLGSRQDLVAALYYQGKFVEAETIATEVLGLRTEILGSRHPDTLKSKSDLCFLHSLRMPLEVIEKEFSDVLGLRKSTLGEEHRDTLHSKMFSAWLYSQKGRYKEAESIFIQVRQLRERTPGFEKDIDSIRITFGIAEMLQNQRQPRKAEKLYRKVYDSCRNRFGDEHPSTIAALTSLSNLLSSQGRYREAENALGRTLMAINNNPKFSNLYHLYILGAEAHLRYQEKKWDDVATLDLQRLTHMRRFYEEPHPATASTKAHLAQARSFQYRFVEAERLFHEALDEMESALGPNHPEKLDCLASLADLRVRQQRWTEAISLYKEILAARKELLGERHQQTIFATMDLARVYTKRRDFSEAEKLFNLVFESRKLYLGSENPLTLDAVSSIAWLRTWQSRWNDAANLYKTVLVAREKAHGYQHPDTVDSMEDLASVYVKLSNFSAANDLYKQALTLRTEVFGESDPKTLNTISRIASLRYQQNRFTDMEQLLQIVLQGYKALPSCTPEVVAITVELAELSRDQCKLHKAEREGEEAVRFGTTQLGSDHPDLKAAKLSLAGTKEFLGKLSEAATLYNEVLDSESKFCGPESPRSLNIAFCQGNLLSLQKQFDEAGPILERALQGQRKLLGEDNPIVLRTMVALADVSRQTGKLFEAETLQGQVLTKQTMLFGECSPSVGQKLTRLASIKECQKNHIEAEVIYKRGIEMQRKFVVESNHDLLKSMANLAPRNYRQGKWTDSEDVWQGVVICQEQNGDGDNPTLLNNLGCLATAKAALAQFNQAVDLQERAVEMAKRLYGFESAERKAYFTGLVAIENERDKFLVSKSETDGPEWESDWDSESESDAFKACSLVSWLLEAQKVD